MLNGRLFHLGRVICLTQRDKDTSRHIPPQYHTHTPSLPHLTLLDWLPPKGQGICPYSSWSNNFLLFCFLFSYGLFLPFFL
ncbi:hypothetical protein BDV41DRAFT_535811, partial [Aspergillus transmontanensis]